MTKVLSKERAAWLREFVSTTFAAPDTAREIFDSHEALRAERDALKELVDRLEKGWRARGDEANALAAKLARADALIREAEKAVSVLPKESLGCSEDYGHFYRDELLSRLHSYFAQGAQEESTEGAERQQGQQPNKSVGQAADTNSSRRPAASEGAPSVISPASINAPEVPDNCSFCDRPWVYIDTGGGARRCHKHSDTPLPANPGESRGGET